jgi:LPXTG-motif cell wall-anchored protein
VLGAVVTKQQLPFTGLSLGWFVLAGGLLLVSGLGLRRFRRDG